MSLSCDVRIRTAWARSSEPCSRASSTRVQTSSAWAASSRTWITRGRTPPGRSARSRFGNAREACADTALAASSTGCVER